MATPLTPIPPNLPPAQANSRRSLRTAVGAGLAAVAIAATVTAAPGTAFAQDTYAQDNAWVPEVVNAPDVWGTTQGEGVTVAVMDTGINDHPFFEGKNILPGYSTFDDEEDGWNDTDGHGSGVSAAVLLVAPEATILPVRSDTGANSFGGAMGPKDFEAFRWAVDNGADILVVPWHLIGARTAFEGEYLETLQYVIDRGAIIVAAAGNEPGEAIGYPGFVPGIVTVTGTDRNGNIWYENTTVGPEVEVAAPADSMTIPLPQDSALGTTELYADVLGGTSMGSGVVGGVAALTWAAHPDLDANNVIQRLTQTAGDGSGNRSGDTGFGLVNAAQAVNAEGIEPVDENPLGYPMGEPGASGATGDESADEGEGEAAPGVGPSGPSETPQANKESNLSTIIVVAAAVVLIGAAIAVWLVLRGRGRKSAAAVEQPGAFNADNGPAPGGYQQTAPPQQQFGPPPGGGQQGYGSPPPGPQGYSSPPNGPQGFTPPPSGADQSPPWRPGDRQ